MPAANRPKRAAAIAATAVMRNATASVKAPKATANTSKKRTTTAKAAAKPKAGVKKATSPKKKATPKKAATGVRKPGRPAGSGKKATATKKKSPAKKTSASSASSAKKRESVLEAALEQSHQIVANGIESMKKRMTVSCQPCISKRSCG